MRCRDEDDWASGGGKREGVVAAGGEEGAVLEPPRFLAGSALRQLILQAMHPISVRCDRRAIVSLQSSLARKKIELTKCPSREKALGLGNIDGPAC